VQGVLHLSSGIECQVFSESAFPLGVQVWGSNGLVRWNWDSPQIFVGFDESGYRIQIEPEYQPYQYSEFDYLTGALRGMISALETGAELPISGHDLCQAVEIAIALKESARRGNVPVSLPLEDRSLSLVPVPYRWDGGHATGGRYPDESGRLLPGWPYDLDGEG
jgi:hypothetical protein